MMNYVNPQANFSQVKTTADEAWFVVLIAVLLTLGATVVLGCAVWCFSKGHGSFTGSWYVNRGGVSISLQCTN